MTPSILDVESCRQMVASDSPEAAIAIAKGAGGELFSELTAQRPAVSDIVYTDTSFILCSDAGDIRIEALPCGDMIWSSGSFKTTSAVRVDNPLYLRFRGSTVSRWDREALARSLIGYSLGVIYWNPPFLFLGVRGSCTLAISTLNVIGQNRVLLSWGPT